MTFFRQVTKHGNVHLLSQTFFVGKRLKGEYVKVLLDTKRAPPHCLSVWLALLQAVSVSFLEEVTVISVSTNGGCHTLLSTEQLLMAVLSILAGIQGCCWVRNMRSMRETSGRISSKCLH